MNDGRGPSVSPASDRYCKGSGVTPLGAWLQRFEHRNLERLLTAHGGLTSGTKFLEIGPGKGAFARYLLSRHELDYSAIEVHEESARALEADGVTSICSAVPPFPLQDQSVDVVFAKHVLEHMASRSQAVEFVAEARRVLREGGLLILAVPNIVEVGWLFFHDYTHNMPFMPSSLRWLVTDGGFRVLRCVTYNGPFFGPLRHLVSVARKLLPWSWLARLQTGYPDEGPFFKAQLTFCASVLVIAIKT